MHTSKKEKCSILGTQVGNGLSSIFIKKGRSAIKSLHKNYKEGHTMDYCTFYFLRLHLIILGNIYKQYSILLFNIYSIIFNNFNLKLLSKYLKPNNYFKIVPIICIPLSIRIFSPFLLIVQYY